MSIRWYNTAPLPSKNFKCGYCDNIVASDKGYPGNYAGNDFFSTVYICPHCTNAIFFLRGKQVPGVRLGEDVKHLPKEIQALYNEARDSSAAGAPTAAILICRKMLMNIAVTEGAEEGLKFIEYVDYLANKGYVPPNGKDWVDHIRQKGNEATHEIKLMTAEDAEELISFTSMLLKFIYEFPSRVPVKTA